jgi:XTP/dITP diphosphohydrolase
VVPESDFNVASPVETGTTFVENAIIKARNAARHTGLPALADDSGIAVDCLNGQPGIYSSRYAGENATDEANLDKLLREVSRFPEQERTARYWCILAFMRHAEDPTPVICQACWKGRIILEKRGQNGFGYDPLFLIPVLGQTAAELDPEVKKRLSHRGQALAKLREALREICAGE